MDPKIYKAIANGDAKCLENLSPDEWSEFCEMKSHHGNTILHIAIQYRKWSIAKMIIRKCNSLLHEQNFNGDTPLHLSVRYPKRREIRMVRLLIQDDTERKRLVRIENMKGDTALHEAVRSNNMKAVELLIGVDRELACVNNNEGESPIFIAVDKSFYKVARHILKMAPTCSFAGRKGMNVLHAVVMRSKHSIFYNILWLLFRYFGPIAVAIYTFLFYAGRSIVVWFVIMAALSLWCLTTLWCLSVLKSFKFTTLWCLSVLKSFKFTTIGSDFISEVYQRDSSTISQADQFGWIPLHYAAYIGNIQVVELLLKLDNSDTLLRMKENEGMSALHIAAKGNQTFVVKRLSKKHPYTNEYLDNKGRTAFHVAAEDGKVNVVKYFKTRLVLAHVVNQGDIDGNTPLHLAALQRRKKVCKLLISHSRIDLGARNKVGLTAIDIIKSKELFSMKRLSKYAQSLEHFVAREYIKQDEESRNEVLTSSINNEIVKVEEHASKRKHSPESFKDLANVNLIIVTIVATVTFTAAITVPGGYNSDSKDEHAGTAILTKKAAFQTFAIANSVAFGLSTALLTLHLWNAIVRKDENAKTVLKWSLKFRNWAVLAMVVAFLAAEYVVLASSRGLAGAAVAVACYAFFAPAFAISWDDNPIFTPISFLVKTIFRPMD